MVMLHFKMLHYGDIHEGFGSCRQRSPLEEVDSPHAALPQPVIPGSRGKPTRPNKEQRSTPGVTVPSYWLGNRGPNIISLI